MYLSVGSTPFPRCTGYHVFLHNKAARNRYHATFQSYFFALLATVDPDLHIGTSFFSLSRNPVPPYGLTRVLEIPFHSICVLFPDDIRSDGLAESLNGMLTESKVLLVAHGIDKQLFVWHCQTWSIPLWTWSKSFSSLSMHQRVYCIAEESTTVDWTLSGTPLVLPKRCAPMDSDQLKKVNNI